MTEKEALREFTDCANRNDLEGCLAALKNLSAKTINEQNDDGYDMLIGATVAGNECAVEALLEDGRCDLTNRESLCGMTAEEFAQDYPEGSRIRDAFEFAYPAFIFRNGELIPREEIFYLIMTDAIEADEDTLSLLPDSSCAKLAKHSKISSECWKCLLELRPGLAALSQ